MRVVVTGATGMLGHALLPLLGQKHHLIGLSSRDCDICDALAVMKCLRAHQPECVVHLAAYTDVDGCEKNPERAKNTNGTGTRNVAQACAEIGATMLYASTDYVFDGDKLQSYREDDSPNPINIYGHSKLLGEQRVKSLLDRYFIVRTSWLFGPRGKNFVTAIVKVALAQQTLRVVNDQHGSPTYTRHLASKLAELVETKAYGVYHVTGSGSCSWFEFAQAITELYGFREVQVSPISSAECARPARRPANSILENRHLLLEGINLLPHWKVGLKSYLDELRAEDSATHFQTSAAEKQAAPRCNQ